MSYAPSKSEQILKTAGYKMGSNGLFVAPNGKPLSVTIQVISGYSDYISILQILTQELKQAGIDLVTQPESSSAFSAAQADGTFQLLIAGYGFTPSAYAYYYSLLDSKESAAIGQTASGDYGRFHSAQLDSLLSQIAAKPTAAAAANLFYQVENIVAQQLPYIPVLEPASGTEFNGAAVTGFPTAAHPYGPLRMDAAGRRLGGNALEPRLRLG